MSEEASLKACLLHYLWKTRLSRSKIREWHEFELEESRTEQLSPFHISGTQASRQWAITKQ